MNFISIAATGSAITDRGVPLPRGLVALASLVLACGNGAEPAPAPAVDRTLYLEDANNYRTMTELSIPTIETASGTDLDVCWGDVDTDLLCHDVAPTSDLDNVGLVRVYMNEDKLEERLVADTLSQSEVSGYIEYNTDHESTCAKLSSFSFFETVIDVKKEYVESDERTYLLLFTTGTKPGMGARSMVLIKPTADSENTKVEAPTGCGLLDFSADLHSSEPLRVPRVGPWPLDWRKTKSNGQGEKLAVAQIDSALIGFYADKTVADIETGIFDLETMATSLWEIPLTGGRTTSLELARERGTDAPFPGFEREESGVWLLGLFCTTCANPAPLVLTVLEPE